VTVLLLAAVPLTHLRFDLSFTSGLPQPQDDPVQQGERVLDGSRIRGVTAPTEILVEESPANKGHWPCIRPGYTPQPHSTRPAKSCPGQRFTLLIPLHQLPFGQQITSIAVQGSGITVHTQGSNIVVAP